jgi:hypothetical protein
MKKLTSKATFFHKRIFPLIWFGFLGVFICIGVFSNVSQNGPGLIILVVPIGMAIFGYFIMKKLVWDLIDEVYDEDSSLLFRNGNQEVRVYLKDVKNVSYSTMTNPPRVTLSIRYKTALGDELTFSPPASWVPFKKNEDIERLIDRIDEARR